MMNEQNIRIERWCSQVGEDSWKCAEARNENLKCKLDSVKSLAQSGGQLPGVGAGGPAPTDIFAPIIGEGINATNN